MRIAVCGLGRAGKVLAHKLIHDDKNILCCGICRDISKTANEDIGHILEMPLLNIPVIPLNRIEKELIERKVDVVIDFSHKDTTMQLAKVCQRANVSLIVCTTNFEPEELVVLQEIGNTCNAGMVYAPNLTIGVNLLMSFVERMSKLVPDFDFEIIERHRKDKKRITTTAKLIAARIHRENVPISSVRLNGYVGVHEVTATNENERITIVHESFSREAFASGALMAAQYIVGKKGYHEMADVIKELEKNI